MQSVAVEQQQPHYLLLEIPRPLEQFRSVRSGIPPFLSLLRWLERETGTELGFPDIAVGPVDFAGFRVQTALWCEARQRLGFDTEVPVETAVDLLCAHGLTAPVLNRRLRPGDVLVAEGGAK